MTRLLYVCAPTGFFVSHRLPLAIAARAQGFDVHVMTPRSPEVDAIRAAGLTWHELQLDRGGTNIARELTMIRIMVRAYRALRPDVVHHVTIKPVLYGTIAARIARVPRVINAVSGLGYLFTGNRPVRQMLGTLLYRISLRHRGMKVIVQNHEDFSFFVDRGLVARSALVLIPGSGVDLARFHPVSPPERPTVVQICRMLGDKGVREFIASARLVRADRPDVRFILVGGPDAANPTSIPIAKIEQAAAAGIVDWLGERRDIPDILATATIFCLPSYREGLPKSLIEAAAAGLPLVTTDTSGCREVVTDGVNGLLVPVGDAPALAAAIRRLLGDPALCDRLGRAARADAEARFDIRRIIAAQLALYGSPDEPLRDASAAGGGVP